MAHSAIDLVARRARAALSLVVLAVLLIGGCARDVHTAFPDRGQCARGCHATGSVAVELSNPAKDLTVSIAGAIVAKRKHSQRVVVTGVPAGMVTVDVAFGGGTDARAEHHLEIEVLPGSETAVVLPGPERSLAGAIQTGLYTLGSWIFLGMIYAALL